MSSASNLQPPPVNFDPDAPVVGDGIFGLPFTPEQSRAVVIPVPFDATQSYHTGAAKAPAAILKASQQGDLHDETLKDIYKYGIAMLPIPEMIENLNRDAKLRASSAKANAAGEKVNRWVHDQTVKLMKNRQLPIVLGGDHSVPFGAISAIAEQHPGMGVLMLDAHMDLREAYEGFTWSHASIAYNVMTRLPMVEKLVQFGPRDFGVKEEKMGKEAYGRIMTFTDYRIAGRRMEGEPFESIARDILAPLPAEVYLTFDIDGLEPSLCPHTGTPVPGGIGWNEVRLILKKLTESGRRIIGLDLCEVSPSKSLDDDWDANVGMNLLYQMIGWALKTR